MAGKTMDKLIDRGLNARTSPGGERIMTERLVLRPLRYRDAKDFYAYARDPEVARYVLWDPHTSLGQTRGILHSLIIQSRLEGLRTRAITLRDSGRMVGTIGLVSRDWENHSAEVGFSLARDCWNQGLASEALAAYLEDLFTKAGLHRVEAQHDLLNPASGAVMRKAGMRKEGVLKDRMFYKGRYASLVLYAAVADGQTNQPGEKVG